jgi:hypothetical protein
MTFPASILIHAAPAAPTYGLGDLMRRLGQVEHRGRARSTAWQIDYLRGLIADCSFPAPLPLRIRDRDTRATRMTTDVQRASRWLRAAVDQWFEDQLPPGTGSGDVAEQRAGEQIMDERAAAIGLRMVDGGRS